MSIIEDAGYLDEYDSRRGLVQFPPELAVLIVRKASALATKFELEAIETMKTTAERALRRGADMRVIIRQMEL